MYYRRNHLRKSTRHNLVIIALIAIIGAVLNLAFATSVKAQAAIPETASDQVVIYMFWGDGCPHCAKEKPFLEDLAKADPRIILKFYEVWGDQANRDKFDAFAKAFGFEPSGVPTTFIGDQYWVGYNDQIESDIKKSVDACLVNGCPDAGARVPESGATQPVSTPVVTPEPVQPTETDTDVIKIPFYGEVDLKHQSLFVSTLLIAFVDGVNPCSIWVLTMLLALTMHTGSRKKILIIGLIFISVTAGVYGLFILGLFSVLAIIPFQGAIQVIVALVALVFAIINIKDYFWYKEGVSLTIADDKKPGIYKKMRKVIDAQDSFWGLAGATVVLAAGVSLVEFSCTAGFPVVWTNLLNSQQVTWVTFALLLLAYLVVYQLDELAIFFAAVFTLKASKLEEKEGRILKLIGGVLMLSLAIVMLFNPSLMNNLSGSLIVFGIAFGVTVLVLLVHRVILPRMGVKVGSEFNNGKAGTGKKTRKGK